LLVVGAGVGVGVGRALDLPRDGDALAVLCPAACRFELWPEEGLALVCAGELGPVLPGGLGDGLVACEVVVTAGAEWLSTFMNPTVPTAPSMVARQVRVESLRRLVSRRKARRSRYRIGANEIGN
jgi:hypothetical protein